MSLRKGIGFCQQSEDRNFFLSFRMCAGHGMSSVGDKPTTGSYRQV